jgi:hypothetical protein
MGYYSAGGWSPPSFTAAPSSFNVATAGRGVADTSSGAAADAAPYRPRTRVLNLSALSRAFRRVDRATKLAAKLFHHKKMGFHGLKPRSRKRK